MKDLQGDHIQRGRQKSQDQCEDDGSDTAESNERVTLPKLAWVAAFELEDQTPRGKRCRTD